MSALDTACGELAKLRAEREALAEQVRDHCAEFCREVFPHATQLGDRIARLDLSALLAHTAEPQS